MAILYIYILFMQNDFNTYPCCAVMLGWSLNCLLKIFCGVIHPKSLEQVQSLASLDKIPCVSAWAGFFPV